MTHDDSKAQYEWWKTLQELDMTKVKHLIGLHPHLIWTRMIDPVFRPIGYNTFLETFGDDLCSCLDDLNTLQWLLFYYHSHMDVNSLVLDLLNKITLDDLAINGEWGTEKNTLLHLVSALGYDDLALLLLDKGVRADVPNALGRLPYHVARTEAMIHLFDLDYRNKKSIKILGDDHDASPGVISPNSSRSQRLQPSPSVSTEASPSIAETPTIKKPNKDGHYFRAGHVEETKQKVLTDEQVELQKQRERRRKDIAQLAKRSAVKNNPFVKKSEPSLAQASSRQGSMVAASSNDTTANGDATGSSSSSHVTTRDRKHKRNSKVINSLQTKSYVSSSIFRQGEPAGNSLRSYLVQSHDKHPSNATTDTHTTTISTGNPATESRPESRPTSSAALEIPSLTSNGSNGTKSYDTSYDENTSEKNTVVTDMDLANDIQQQNELALEHNHEKSVTHENTPSPSSSSTTSLVSASTSISTSISKSSSTYEDPLEDQHLSTSTNTPTDIVSSTASMSIAANTTNGSSSKGKNIGNKRQSGSQKSHWSNELASWESVLNREFDLDKNDGNTANGSASSVADLETPLENASLKHSMETVGIEGRNGLKSGNTPTSHHEHNSEDRQQQHQQQWSNTDNSDDVDTKRSQGSNRTMFESSRLPLKSYGSVSVKSMATYSRRLPTFDTPLEIGKTSDSPATPSQIDNALDLSGGGLTTLAATKSSDYQHHRHHGEKEMTRSMSVLNTSSSSTHTANDYYQQPKSEFLVTPAYLAPMKLPSGISTDTNCGRGKLYIRVHGVHDVLLPLPRDRAHVRCVIGDGRYEYMSRYETLEQDMTFGYECIIDSHPDMIVTLSLHVRPDYMLKKPLTRLFSTSRKRKGSLSAYVSSEDGAVGQTRFVVGDMLSACHRRSYSASFHCFNAWYIHSREKSSLPSTSSRQQDHDSDQGVLKVIGNFDVELLYLPVSDPSLPVPKNLRECDMAIKMQHWNETRIDTDHYPKIQRAPPRLAQEKSMWSVDQ